MYTPMPLPNLPGVLLLLVSLVIAGCGSAPVVDDLEEYHGRLGRVLEAELEMTAQITPLPFPGRDELFQHVPAMNINLREFHALQQCEIGTLVAERNTALGRTPFPAQRLSYETRLLHAIDDCAEHLRSTRPELAQKLSEWKSQKQQQRKQVWANLIQTAKAMRLAMSLPRELLQAEQNRDARAAVTALGFLTQLKNNDTLSLSELETQLKQIESARLPARLWATQQLLADSLSQLTRRLTPHLSAVTCTAGRASEQAEILRNVFYLYFIERIQPVGSKVNELQYQLQPTFTQWQNDSHLQPAFKAFLTDRLTGFEQYQQAVSEHVSLWQQFLKRCNLSPVAPAT
ncbi:DUF3080 domain-containing protein [Alteromonas sp. ASW11-19]|uniref:DUF3080 domain-containing protein n=1 Tax=Alteromonas salexigens TaxID=2982530 RepID=A0ABT2VKQ5_9ALTE|nr:DUF3080 domain-containing protein [Alteromonas salexigens]MCU7553881.1 DUF3080 domain-containing protein [Alteromonas salexigens]